jgi:hypothetical protein
VAAAPAGKPLSQEEQAANMMKNMDSTQLKSMMDMQRNMMKSNPDMFKKMMASNPAMAGMSAESMEKQMDMMADMDPEQLKKMMGMAQKVQGVAKPLMDGYGKLNAATGGQARSIVMVVVAIFVFYLIDRWFL